MRTRTSVAIWTGVLLAASNAWAALTWSTAVQSPPVRYDIRSTFGGKLVAGTVAIGDADGGAVAAWDTTALADGWNPCTSGANATDLYVLNSAACAIEEGRLAASASWGTDVTHVVRHWVVVPSGKTLTIEAGAVVKFCPETGIRIEDGGKLLILSDAENETILASVAADDWGAVLADTGVEDATAGRIVLQTSSAQLVEMGGHVRLFNVSMPQIPTVSVQSTTAVRGGGMAYVPFAISGGTRTNEFSVDWEAVDGTATYGDDYLLASGTVTWANSSAGTKTVAIPLNTEHVTGEKTTFTVRLVAAHSAYLSSTASTGTVTITERNTLDMTWSAAASASAPSRFDSRASFSGHLVTGTEPIGEPGGEAVTAWDTTSAANGWTDVEAADASATESLYVFNDSGVTVEGGRLAGTATWSNDVTHLVRHWVVIPRGVTLNVTAGTVVKFCPDTGIRIEDGGRLSVIGEEGNDAIFTSVNDDTAGVAIPATEVEGKPGRIVLQSSSAQFYDNGFLQVRFGYGAYPSVTVQDSSAFRSMGVAYVLFTVGGTTRTNRFSVDWRAVDGTATYGADYLLATGTVTWASSSAGTKTVAIPLNATNVAGEIKSFTIQIVTNRSVNVADGEANVEIRELDFLPLVWGNGAAEAARYDTRTNFGGTLVTAVQPIGEPDGSALLRWNTAELADGWHEVNAASGSATAALYSLNDPEIAIEGGRVPAGSTTWGSNVTHLVRHDIVIPSGATLNLAAGAVVKFCPGTRIYIQDGGTLNIAGAADANVIFTGINDDEAGKEVVGTGIDPALRIGAIVKQSSSAKITDTGYLQVQNINAVAGYPSIRLNDAVADRANGFAWIPVTLSGDSRSTRFDIDWETVDGTARFGTDYLMATGHIDWASTSQGTKWIQLPLDTTPTGERRQFQVRIKTARAANIVGKYAYVDIYELDSAKVESFDVRLWTNTVDEAECAIDTEIVETPWIDDDVLDIRYSPTWQDEVPADEAYAEVSLETDDGVTLLARGDPGESGFVTLDMNTIPYGVYTLRHKIFDADGNLLGAYLKDFLYLDPDSTEVHFGELTSNETWRADKVHVVYGTVSVPAIYTLFFEPGAIVKFFTGASIRLASGAALFANDVVFTHVSDDTVGGDTCFDGFAQKPVLDAYSFSGSVTLGQDCDLRYITIKTSIPASITTDYTLYRGAIYEVTNNVTVQSGATLTIHPGTILKFATNTALNVASGGRLSAIGSRAAPIVFTSIRDDEHGGDSNHDGEATVPQPGDWVKISTSGDAEAIFRHCQILYSSRNSTTGAINMNGGTVELTDSIIAHGLYDAVGVESGNFFMTNSVIWDCLTAFRHWPRDPIVNSVFYDCGRLTQGGDQHFVNCVFSKITDTWEAFGFPRSTYTNCVFWNEEGSVLTGEGTQDAMTVCGQNGNIWGDPLFVDPEHADFRILIDSPCVDAADSLVAPAADHFGQPRFTFAGGEPAGIPDESGAYADIGLCELQLRAVTSGHDISAVAVKTVGDIRPGNPLCVQWVVGNDGEEALEENWRDTLSLVSENGDIVELGEKFHLGTIQAGGEYNAMDWFEVPALAEGNWRARLVANAYRDVYEGALTNNNEAFSSAVYPVAATVVPASGGAFAVPAGATAFLRITGLTTDGGILSFASDRIQDLSVSRAFPSAEWPWTWRLDSALAGSLVIPSVSATNSVYLFVRNEGAFPTEVSTSLAPIVPAIDGFSPSALPAAFPAVLHLTGTALDRIESVALYDGNTRVAFATDVAHTSSVEAAATFDLSQVPPGSAYTVSAVIDGVSVAAPGTLAVAPAIDDGEVTAWLDLPDAVRDGRVFAGRIHYRNSGAADMLVPVFKLYATEATTRLAKRRDDEFLPVPLYLVGASPSFPQYVLKAGEETTIPFYFTMRGHYHLVLERLTTDTEINPAEFIARWWFREQQKLDTAAQRAANEAMRQEMLPAAIEAFRAEYERCCARTNIGYSIRGTASFADGTAAACETLAIYYAGGERGALQQTVTDEDGGFVFTTLGTGTNYCIQGVTVSVPHRDGIAIDGADVSGVAVEVSPRGCVRGVVRNAADTNVVYAGLTVFAQDGFKFVSETVTDENGEYAFRGLRFGDIAIQTDVPDGMAFGYAETRLDKDNLLAQVDFALGPGVDVTGTLYEDGTSEPVTNALLNLHDAETRLWTGTAITDDDGRFEFKAVPANSTVLVSVAGSAWRMADTSTSLAIGAESMETDLFVIEQALFEAFPTSGPVPLSVGFFLFDPGLTNQAASFAWDFDGDGQTDSSYANPLVRFGAPGTYDVSLVVTYTNGLVVTSKVDACVTTHEPLPTVYQPGVLVLLDGDEANTGDWAIDGYDGDNRILRLTALSSSPAITPAEGTPLVFKNEKGIYRWRRVSSVSSAGNAWTLATTNADSLSEIYYSFEFFESTLDNPELAGNAPAPARRGRKDPADNSGEGDEEGEEGGEGGEGGNGSGQQQNTTEVKGDLSNGKGSAQVHSQQSVSGENGPLTYEFHQETHASVECTVDGSVGRDDKSVSGRTTTSCKSEFETEGGASAGFHESWEKTGNPIEIADGTTITPWAQGSVDGDISMSWNASGSQEYTRTDEWSVSNDNSYDHSSHSSSSGNIDYGVEAQGHLGAEATIGFDINSEYVNGSFQVGVGVDCSATGTANGDGFSGSYGCEVTTGMEYTFNADNPTKWFDPTETIQNLADKAADEWNSQYNGAKDKALDELGGALDDMDKQLLDALNNYKNDLNVPDNLNVNDLLDPDLQEQLNDLNKIQNSDWPFPPDMTTEEIANQIALENHQFPIDTTSIETQIINEEVHENANEKFNEIVNQNLFCLPDFNNRLRKARPQRRGAANQLGILTPAQSDFAHKLGNGTPAFAQGLRRQADALVSRTVDYGDGTVETFTPGPSPQGRSGDRGDVPAGIPEQITHDYTHYGLYLVTVQDHYEHVSPPPIRFFVSVKDYDVGNFQFPTALQYAALPWLGTNYQVGVSDPWATNAATPLSAAFCLMAGLPPDPSIYEPADASPAARALLRRSGSRDSDGDGIPDVSELQNCTDPKNPEDPEDEPDPENPTEEEDEEEDDSVTSEDPNAVSGPEGCGDPGTERFVWAGKELEYTIFFENKADATADAQEVTIELPLDPAFDWESFEAETVVAGATVDDGLDGKQCATSQVYHAASGFDLRSSIVLDTEAGKAQWYLRVFDTNTFDGWPQDAFAGFLPPNDNTGRGEGHVTFRVKVRDGVEFGTRVTVAASIVFDYNEAIATEPSWWNTVSPPWYAVAFVDEDGSVLKKAVQYPEGTAADDIVQPAEPTKAADERWVYEFAGWTPPLAEVTTNATYGATYRAEVRKYDVTFVWHGGEASATYPYGTEAGDVAVPDDPPDYVENGMIHTFAGWSPAEVADVTGEVTYTATYDEAAAIARIVGGAYYPSLAQAIVAAESGATVVLLADDEVSFAEGGVVIDKDLVIDGAGFTVKGVSNANIHNVTANATPPDVEFDGVDGTNVQGFFVKGGDLAFTNLVFSEFGDTDYVNKFGYTPIQTASAYEGRLVIADVNFEKFNRTAICIRGGTFSIAGVNIDANAENRDVLAQGKDHFQQPIEIRGGTGTIDGVAISGGDVYGSNGGGAIVAWSDVTVRNVDIDFTGVGIWADYANIAVEGEDTSVAATGKALFVEDGGSITVAAGDFSGELAVDAVEGSAIAVNGGTFDAPVPAEFAGAGLLPTTLPDANGKYTVAAARTVTFDSNGGTPVEAAAVAHGEPVAAPDPAPEREHYTFRAWQLAGSDYDFAAPVTADIDLVADWTPDRFTVTFVDEDGVTVLKKATEYDYGTPAADIAKPADPAKAGDAQYSHPFTGWSPEIADVTADATYRATYGTSLNQYTVKFVGDLGEVISSARYDYGTPASAIVVPPDPEKATAQYVYTFQGWAPAFAAVTGNAAYMATYTGVAYHPERELQVLTFDSIGGVCPISTLTCEVGGKYGPLPRPVWSPNVFLGWFTEPEGGVQKTKNSTVTKAAERTFYAHWKKRQAVTFDANGGTCWAATRIYDAGVAYGELPIPKRDGKAFLGWFTAATGGEAVTVESIVPDVGARTLWAHWSGEQTVAFEAGGGTCDPATKTVELGEKYGPLPTPVWPPNVFLGWFTAEEGGSRVTANTTVGKEAAKTLWAHWRKRQVATFEANGGTCWAATRIYDAGAPYGELPVPKRDGQGFLGWFTAEVDGEPVTVESIVPDIGARTLWAHWTTEQTVTFDANGGTCDPAEKTVAIGGKYGPLPTPAWNGHKFLGWFTAAEEGSRVTANTTVWTVAGKTLWAHWNETAGSLSITGFAVKRPAGPAARDARGQAVGVLSFEAEAGRVYELQWTTVLGGEWTAGRRWTAETDGETSVEVPATPGETTGFYRLAAPAE